MLPKEVFLKIPKIGLKFSLVYRLNVLMYRYVRVFNKDFVCLFVPDVSGPTWKRKTSLTQGW